MSSVSLKHLLPLLFLFPANCLPFVTHSPVTASTNVAITWVPMNDCVPQCSRYTIFGKKRFLDSSLCQCLCHLKHRFLFLSVGEAAIRHLHGFHASALINSNLENKNTLLNVQLLFMIFLQHLFNFEEGLKYNLQIGRSSSWAETIILASSLVFCFEWVRAAVLKSSAA